MISFCLAIPGQDFHSFFMISILNSYLSYCLSSGMIIASFWKAEKSTSYPYPDFYQQLAHINWFVNTYGTDFRISCFDFKTYMRIIVNTRKIEYKLLTFGFGIYEEERTWGAYKWMWICHVFFIASLINFSILSAQSSLELLLLSKAAIWISSLSLHQWER